MEEGTAKLIKLEHQRNGVTGVGFYVALFDMVDDDGKTVRMVAVTFDDKSQVFTAGFNVKKLAEGEIEFGKNSFRGDVLYEYMRQWILQCERGKIDTETQKSLLRNHY